MWAVIINLLAKLFGAFIGEKERTSASEQVGADKQAAATEEQARAQVKAVSDVIVTLKPLTADDVQHIAPGTDPDFRD